MDLFQIYNLILIMIILHFLEYHHTYERLRVYDDVNYCDDYLHKFHCDIPFYNFYGDHGHPIFYYDSFYDLYLSDHYHLFYHFYDAFYLHHLYLYLFYYVHDGLFNLNVFDKYAFRYQVKDYL